MALDFIPLSAATAAWNGCVNATEKIAYSSLILLFIPTYFYENILKFTYCVVWSQIGWEAGIVSVGLRVESPCGTVSLCAGKNRTGNNPDEFGWVGG